jgi:small subunit ribosomal protein S9
MEKEATIQLKGKYNGAVGRRKEAVARVRIYNGTGQILINRKDYKEYYTNESQREAIYSPLKLLGLEKKFDVSAIVSGGGKNGQLDAICHGISRALVVSDEGYKTTLKKSGFLTRDPRAKERKKCGLKRARKAPQFSKR